MTLQTYKTRIKNKLGHLQKCENEGIKIMHSKKVPVNMAVKMTKKMRTIR